MILLILLMTTMASFTLGEPGKCEHKKRGDSVVFNLKYSGQKKQIIWRKDGKVIFEKKNDKIRTGDPAAITSDGSLQLKGLTASDDGKYEGEAYDQEGRSHQSETKTICVIEPVTKPRVTLNCKTKTLSCDGLPSNATARFSWKENNKKLPTNTEQTYPMSKTQRSKKYSCTAENDVSMETSPEIEIKCGEEGKAGSDTWTLPGFEFWTTVLILAGGGALLLILVMVLVICLCRRRRHEMRLRRDEEELRLANLTHCQQPHPPSHLPRQAPPAKAHAAPYGHAPSEDQPPALPKPRSHARPRPAHPRGPAHDGENPPPRPKPRKGPRPQRS